MFSQKLCALVVFADLIFCASIFAGVKQRGFPQNATPEQFAQWQEDTRVFLAEALYNGKAPARAPLDPKWGQKEDHGSYVIQEFEFTDRPRHAVHGWLARPKQPAAPKLPAIIALHGHNGRAYKIFHKGYYFYGDLLAQKGYIVLAIDINHLTLDNPGPYLDRGPVIHFKQNTPMGQRVWMTMRAVDFLQTLPDADPDRIGIVGLSNGGITTEFAAALDTRLKVVVSSGSLVMYDRWWAGDLTPCRCEYIPKLEGQLDYYDVFALVAPRPLLIQNGEQDNNFLIDSAKEAFTRIKKAYTIDAAADLVRHDVFPGPHEFRAEAPLMWFEKFLPLD